MIKRYVWYKRAIATVTTAIGLLIIPVAVGTFLGIVGIACRLVYGIFY